MTFSQHFWYPTRTQLTVVYSLCHNLKNQQFGQLGDHFMQSTEHHAPVSTKVFFKFLNEIIVCQRLLTSPWLIMSIVLPALNSQLFTHILPVHNIPIHTNNMTMNFSFSFSLRVEKSSNKALHTWWHLELIRQLLN